MVDIEALMNALPVSALAPNWVGSIGGFVAVRKGYEWQDRIMLLEPPAGQRIPYIEPERALDILLRGQSVEPEDAKVFARDAVTRMTACIGEDRWIDFFDQFEPETPACIPVADLVAWLRDEHRRGDQRSTCQIPADIADFFERAAEVAASASIFRGPDHWDEPWSLQTLPALPPPKAMIEFVPGAPWADNDGWGDEWKASHNPFMRWREAIRPVALDLEKTLGEPVYYFADLDCDIDDDSVHRFLVLHWYCTWKPQSAFVRYLVKVSKAADVEELKAALIDPASYTQPFEMNDAFVGLEAQCCRFDYLAPQARRTVAVVFSTIEARRVAQRLLAQAIGAHACIVAPEALATDDWVRQATHYCRSREVRFVHDGQIRTIETLALVDELCVVADEAGPKVGFDLKLPEAVEDLLWWAIDLGLEARYFGVDGAQLMNPDSCLRQRGVPARVAARQAQRGGFTRRLKELRLDNDYGSSGLWDAEGRMLSYDLLDLPFPLVRRIAAWQRDYDDTVAPPDKSSEAWWKRHDREEIEIAKALQTAAGPGVAVKLYRERKWLPLEDVEGAEGAAL